MIKIYCDKCKKETLRCWTIGITIDEKELIGEGTHDLCDECYEEFKKWIEND